MTEAEKSRVLNALYGYKSFKKYTESPDLRGGGIMLCPETGAYEIITMDDVPKAIKVAELTHFYFDIKDDSQGRFIEMYFFKRISRAEVMHKVGVSYGTIQNWRTEAIEIAERIARKIGFI